MQDNLIIKTLNGNNVDIPIWFLRQAGRHIPEYFKIREKETNFIKFCLNEELIIKSTKLPLKYYDLDAAIIFSDILMIPWAMNRNVEFTKNFGPALKPMIPDETKIIKNISIICVNEAKSILEHTLTKGIVPLTIAESQAIKPQKTEISEENIKESIAH